MATASDLTLTWGQADRLAKPFVESSSTMARGVRAVWPYLSHGATAVYKSLVAAFDDHGTPLAGFQLSSLKNAHAAGIKLSQTGHVPTDEDFDRWAIAAVRIVRTPTFGGVPALASALATKDAEGNDIVVNVETITTTADNVEEQSNAKRREAAAAKNRATNERAPQVPDGSEGSEEAAPKTPESVVVPKADDATSLSDVSTPRLIRTVTGRLKDKSFKLDKRTDSAIRQLIEAYTARVADDAIPVVAVETVSA